MSTFTAWSPADAAAHIAIPQPDDDKYSRGVLGVVTGSARFPGAAVLGVDAALHTGVGMVRYYGPSRVRRLVLERRPEVVTERIVGGPGHVQAWLLGSGMAPDDRTDAAAMLLAGALAAGRPTVLDAGALDLVGSASAQTVITPHYRELARVLAIDPDEIAVAPSDAAARAAESLGVTVLLKGHDTYIAAPDGTRLVVGGATPWLATAGTGDALGGILGAMLATNARAMTEDPAVLPGVVASAVVVHGLAAERAGNGGPFTVLGLSAAIPAVIAELLRH